MTSKGHIGAKIRVKVSLPLIRMPYIRCVRFYFDSAPFPRLFSSEFPCARKALE